MEWESNEAGISRIIFFYKEWRHLASASNKIDTIAWPFPSTIFWGGLPAILWHGNYNSLFTKRIYLISGHTYEAIIISRLPRHISTFWAPNQFILLSGYGTHLVNLKHKVFFWLLMNDRLNTRGLLRRNNMALDSYVCELCILQKEESLKHLFLSCNFAMACWASIGITYPRTIQPLRAIKRIKKLYGYPSTWR